MTHLLRTTLSKSSNDATQISTQFVKLKNRCVSAAAKLTLAGVVLRIRIRGP